MIVRVMVFLLSVASAFSVIAQEKPNFLFLVTEDMSPYLSCYGNKLIKTPNLDKLSDQ